GGFFHQVKRFLPISGDNQLIAELQLPAGQWVVFAKAAMIVTTETFNGTEAMFEVRCNLVAGALEDPFAPTDQTVTTMDCVKPDIRNQQTTVLILGVDLKADRKVRLFASTKGGTVSFTDTVIGAINVVGLEITTIESVEHG